MKFLWKRISFNTIFLTSQGCTSSTQLSFFFSLYRSNAGEVQSSNYPISVLTVGYITHYAPRHLAHSLTFTVNLLHMPFISYRLSTLLPDRIRITSSFSSLVSMLGLKCIRIPISLPHMSHSFQTWNI